jgi:ABC-type nitrate/sulfonate/bicarbonate transport system substrate-binding protein
MVISMPLRPGSHYSVSWKRPGARRIADGTGVKQNLCPIFVRQEFATANPELVQKVLKAYQRGYQFAKAHPQEAAQIAAAEVKLPPGQVLTLIGRFDYDPVIRSLDVEELKKTEEFLRANNLSRARVDIDAFVDTRWRANSAEQRVPAIT